MRSIIIFYADVLSHGIYRAFGLLVEFVWKGFAWPKKVCLSHIASHIHERTRDPLQLTIEPKQDCPANRNQSAPAYCCIKQQAMDLPLF